MLMWVYSVSHPVMIQLSASWHQISIFLVKLEAVWSREQYQVILNGGQWGMLTGELVTLALKLNGIDARWDQNAGNKFIFHTFYAGFFIFWLHGCHDLSKQRATYRRIAVLWCCLDDVTSLLVFRSFLRSLLHRVRLLCSSGRNRNADRGEKVTIKVQRKCWCFFGWEAFTALMLMYVKALLGWLYWIFSSTTTCSRTSWLRH